MTSQAAIWFPDGTAGTVLVIVALVAVVAGVVMGRRSGRK